MAGANHFKSEAGQGLVEYVLITALIGLALFLSLRVTGTTVRELYCDIGSGLGGQGCGCTSAFDDPAEIDDWGGSNKEGFLTIEDGKICNSGPKSSFLNSCSKDFGSSDMNADISGVSIETIRGGNSGFDFLFRSQDENNGYHFTYNSQDHLIRFWKRVDGRWILLSSKRSPVEWSQQPELDFQVKVIGDTFTAYKDGEAVLQASDDAYAEGQYGLRNKPGSKTCFDNISVQQLP
ncbi:MAG: hypothetical protein HQ517_03380 [SAR324 cluster bacterium]|nr:hypothetical protein [SAR324 cluster bacterium]